MSEKRFKSYALFKGKKTVYRDNEAYTNEEVCGLLNEQQATIQEQDKRIKELERMLKKCDAERIRLQNERGAIIKFGVRGGSV